MTPFHGHAAMAVVLAAGWASSGCECAERKLHDGLGSTTTMELETSTGGTMTIGAESTTRTTDDTESAVPVSRFMGIFHSENPYLPFGMETMNTGSATIANLEIREDGTASMVMETCNKDYGPLEIAWRWEARPGPWLEFLPASDEEPLQFMALTDLESLRVTTEGTCDLLFEADGVLITYELFRPGKACWVNRCDPVWTVHIDYCDGEAPPPCG
jgi:hypothetical protein